MKPIIGFILSGILSVALLVRIDQAHGQEDVCHEDEPCWVCEEMGNGVCGPLPDGVTIEEIQAEEEATGKTSTEIIAEIEGEQNTTTTLAPLPDIEIAEPAVAVNATPSFTG